MYFKNVLLRLSKILLFTACLWVILFGYLQVGSNKLNQGQICPITGHSMAICQTNPTEHVREWQSAFAMVPIQGVILMLLAFFIAYKLRFLFKYLLLNHERIYTQKYWTRVSNFKLFDPLRVAFSSGILNPKLF